MSWSVGLLERFSQPDPGAGPLPWFECHTVVAILTREFCGAREICCGSMCWEACGYAAGESGEVILKEGLAAGAQDVVWGWLSEMGDRGDICGISDGYLRYIFHVKGFGWGYVNFAAVGEFLDLRYKVRCRRSFDRMGSASSFTQTKEIRANLYIFTS